ncbi:hypothetical protein [Lysobacter claricitrinus]|uniref:hypothetical protein n=1 Tax=Lysobacter claricitrinus TaxID=3367728 RepID=UPI0038B371DB
MEKLLEHTVQQIQRIHLVRKRSQKTFDGLWERVCVKLADLGNASAYARWKQDDITRNFGQLQKLDAATAEAWAASLTPLKPSDSDSRSVVDDRQFKQLLEERSELKPEIRISIDHVLEVAIAYWIEAMNAHKDGDELRVMHALIQCHFHIGIAHALRMTHDAKAADGSRSGQKERDALAKVVLTIMENYTVAKSIHSEEVLLESITDTLEADPTYAGVLSSYEARMPTKKLTKDPISTRFPTTLGTWVRGKDPLYPDLAAQFRKLARQIKKKPASRNIVRRKGNG